MAPVVGRLKSFVSVPARRRVAHARLTARVVTGGRRALPDFLVLGTQRGGTSSLYKYLGRHPDVVPSLRKEIDHFSFGYHALDHVGGPAVTELRYRAHFPLTASLHCASQSRDGLLSPSAARLPLVSEDPSVGRC